MVNLKNEEIVGRILIIGQTFDKSSGGGITISNLFTGIDSKNIGVITSPKQAPKTNKEFCRNVYQLGREELKILFPVSLLYPKYVSGQVNISEHTSKQVEPKVHNSRTAVINLFTAVVHFLGVYNFIFRLELSEKLSKWIKEFNPDFIYSQLSTRELINFVGKIKGEIKKPLIIHIMDDWPLTINKFGIFKRKWDKIIDEEYKNLLKITDSRLCISEAMAEEYTGRYGGIWKHFHNPIMKEMWIPFQKKTYKVDQVFKILYSGRIGIANIKSIIALCDLVNELRGNGILIEFHIYTPEFELNQFAKFVAGNGISLKQPVDHNKMPELLSQYDLLYLPIDFDKLSIRFTRFSMPTKMSEYMISGIPVLVHAPGETAIVKFAKKYEIAVISDDNRMDSFRKTLLDLITNEEKRKKVALNAIKVAEDKFDGIKVREKFQSLFIKSQKMNKNIAVINEKN